MTIEERLNETLNKLEKENSKLKKANKLLKDENELLNDMKLNQWRIATIFKPIKGIHDNLPYPRLEMRLEKNTLEPNRYTHQWIYGLVTRPFYHQFDHPTEFLFTPFSVTQSKLSSPYKMGENIVLPYRDGLHMIADAIALNMRAFVIHVDENIVNEVTVKKYEKFIGDVSKDSREFMKSN